MLLLVSKKVQMVKITLWLDSPCLVKKKNSRIKISHFSLELIFSAKICIRKTWYNWSSDINNFSFHFSGMSVNFPPFLSWVSVWGYVSCTRFITFTEEFQVHLECLIDLGIKPNHHFYVETGGGDIHLIENVFRWGTHLYISLFPSVRPSICPAIRADGWS